MCWRAPFWILPVLALLLNASCLPASRCSADGDCASPRHCVDGLCVNRNDAELGANSTPAAQNTSTSGTPSSVGVLNPSSSVAATSGNGSLDAGTCDVTQCEKPLRECFMPVCVDNACGEAVAHRGYPCNPGVCDGAGNCLFACLIHNETLVNAGVTNPNNPCQVCNPAQNLWEYVDKPDGVSCDDGLFCTGTEQCVSGQCTRQERVCPPETSLCSNELSRCVECLEDQDCPALNPNCNPASHRCVACPDCLCPADQHDDGTGACAPLYQCATGFAPTYQDLDTDGYGSTTMLGVCFRQDQPPPPGYSFTSTDCQDEDGDVWRQVEAFPDADGDHVTGSGLSICVGEDLPVPYVSQPDWAPVVSFLPDKVENGLSAVGSARWEIIPGSRGTFTAHASMDADSTESAPLVVQGFWLKFPSNASITGIAVHVQRHANGPVQDRTVTLLRHGHPVETNKADKEPWKQTQHTVVYGGPTDTWDLRWAAEDLMDPSFGVMLSVGPGEGDGRMTATVERVWIEAFLERGPPDCNEDSPAQSIPWVAYKDVDGDGFGNGEAETLCVLDQPATGFVEDPTADCNEADPRVNPAQTSFFGTPAQGGMAGATMPYDYDCNRVEEKAPVATVTTCTRNALSNSCTSTYADGGIPPQACGTQARVQGCEREEIIIDPPEEIIDDVRSPVPAVRFVCNLVDVGTTVLCR